MASEIIKDILIQKIDPITICNEIRQCRLISDEQYDHIIALFKSNAGRKALWLKLFDFLGARNNELNIPCILRILEKCGYSSLSSKLYRYFGHIEAASSGRQLAIINRLNSQSLGRKATERELVRLKSKVHDGVFRDPRNFLRHLSNKCRIEYENASGNKKPVLADRLTTLLCAEIDSHIMIYKKELPDCSLFTELKAVIPHTSNTLISNIAYHSRLGIAYAVNGDSGIADDHLKIAKMYSDFVDQCVEVDNMFYIHVFYLMCEYDKSPMLHIQQQILEMAELGLKCLENDEDDIRIFWKAMFILRMAHCLLGLNNQCRPILGSTFTQEGFEKAKRLLAEIDKIWNKIEARRKMWYYCARARINEIETNLETAIVFIDGAHRIGIDENFGETAAISSYAKEIKEKHRSKLTPIVKLSSVGQMIQEHDQSNI